MTTEEQDAKVARDLADTQRVIQHSNRILRRINKASEKLIHEGGNGGHRPKPA